MRLIDADLLEPDADYDDGEYWGYSIAQIESAPTVEERKKGRWIELTNTNHTYVCSVCGRMLVNITDGKNMVTKNYPFCHCGADMRGGRDETD